MFDNMNMCSRSVQLFIHSNIFIPTCVQLCIYCIVRHLHVQRCVFLLHQHSYSHSRPIVHSLLGSSSQCAALRVSSASTFSFPFASNCAFTAWFVISMCSVVCFLCVNISIPTCVQLCIHCLFRHLHVQLCVFPVCHLHVQCCVFPYHSESQVRPNPTG